MALLQRCLSQCTSQTTFALASRSRNVRLDRTSPGVMDSGIRCEAICESIRLHRPSPATMDSRIRCGATCESNGSVCHPSEDSAQTPKVFQDDSNGIVCYLSVSGELTCEGWDEGPHFEPERQQQSRARVSKRTLERMAAVSSSSELVRYKCTTGRMGESMCEGMDES